MGCVSKEHAAFLNVYSTSRMIRIGGSIFAGLLGLAFGSFLNVCLSRWPEGESVVRPRSHCRDCDHVLAWWENVPLVSWLALRGRCRKCGAWIGWRYPVVELAVGGLWGIVGCRLFGQFEFIGVAPYPNLGLPQFGFVPAVATMFFLFLMVGIAVLDAERFWIADRVVLPGAALGLAFPLLFESLVQMPIRWHSTFWIEIGERLLGVFLAAGLVLLIRWLYKLIRKREGMGLGDVKLMAMLAAWLGLPGALLAFGLGAVLGSVAAFVLLAVPARDSESWAATKLPFGTFLCIGGIVSSLWGEQMIAAYLHWAGLSGIS